jgi:hypothetical protein
MREADVLLLIENAEDREGVYLPSKFVDYLWAGRPVIALTPRNGTISDYLGPEYRLRADPWDTTAIAGVLESVLTIPHSLETSAETLVRIRQYFDPKSIGNQLVEFLRSCMESPVAD